MLIYNFSAIRSEFYIKSVKLPVDFNQDTIWCVMLATRLPYIGTPDISVFRARLVAQACGVPVDQAARARRPSASARRASATARRGPFHLQQHVRKRAVRRRELVVLKLQGSHEEDLQVFQSLRNSPRNPAPVEKDPRLPAGAAEALP